MLIDRPINILDARSSRRIPVFVNCTPGCKILQLFRAGEQSPFGVARVARSKPDSVRALIERRRRNPSLNFITHFGLALL